MDIALAVDDQRQLMYVAADLALMPGVENGVDILKVLVEGGSPDACVLGDRRHGHTPETVLLDELGSRAKNGFANCFAMRVDRFSPELRHRPNNTTRPRLTHNVM